MFIYADAYAMWYNNNTIFDKNMFIITSQKNEIFRKYKHIEIFKYYENKSVTIRIFEDNLLSVFLFW